MDLERLRREWESTEEGRRFLAHLDRMEAEHQQTELAELEEAIAAEASAYEEKWQGAAVRTWNHYHARQVMRAVDELSGRQFEELVATLFELLGYHNVLLTPNTDFGADVIAEKPDGTRVAIQAKRWNAVVGVAVLQEVALAMMHYDCKLGIVVTNSRFTTAAQSFAAKSKKLKLFDGRWLKEQMEEQFLKESPDFDAAKFRELVTDGQVEPPRIKIESCSPSEEIRFQNWLKQDERERTRALAIETQVRAWQMAREGEKQP